MDATLKVPTLLNTGSYSDHRILEVEGILQCQSTHFTDEEAESPKVHLAIQFWSQTQK